MYSMAALYRRRAHSSTGKPVVFCLRPHKIRNELLAGRKTEDIVQWVKNRLPTKFFLGTDDHDVVSAYTKVMLWVQRHPQYFDQAKAKFATGADGWLVAFAMVRNAIVVTNEQPRPEAKNTIPIPDVCVQFNVTYMDVFFMLKAFGARFEWRGAN